MLDQTLAVSVRRILGVEAASVVNPFYAANNTSHMARPDDLFFLAFSAGELIGTVRFCIEEEAPMLRSMMIHRDYRSRGVGHKLLSDFANYLDAHAHRGTFCLPYGHLVKFYGFIGFEKIAEADAPTFLIERLKQYRAKNPATDYICMRRP